jgi:hypothetical protein
MTDRMVAAIPKGEGRLSLTHKQLGLNVPVIAVGDA